MRDQETDQGIAQTFIRKPSSLRLPSTSALSLLIVVYLLLATVYSISVPILEAPDEMWHYAYVRYLVRERQLPPWDTESAVGQESSQPPLYYATAALATAWTDASTASFLDRNPHWGYPSAGRVNDNKNLFFHQREGAEAFPWRDTALAVHLARLVNLVFGALTVAFSYLLAREVFQERPTLAVFATAWVALNPQFLFISSAVNNDAAISAFSTMALWLLVRGLRRGYTLRRLVILGGAVGLATLSKVSALALLPFAILVIGFRTWLIDDPEGSETCVEPGDRRARRFTRFIVHCSLFVALVLAVSGWWYGRNAVLYGDPFGLGTHLETWWAHEEPLSPAQIWAQLPSIELSFWAAFGWGNVHLPRAFYVMVRLLARLALVGLLTWGLRVWQAGGRPGPRAWSLALLTLWILVVFAALLRWMQLVEAALGRLLFPAIGAIAVLMTWGLNRLSSYILHRDFVYPRLPRTADAGRSVPRSGLVVLGVGLLCVATAAVVSPFVAIRPAYARPPLLSDEEVASRTTPTNIRFGDTVRLVGFNLEPRTESPQSASPGEEISVTLCWKASAPTEENYAYFTHLLGPNESIVGARDTHPGLGRFPTSQWTPGDAFCDVMRVPVAEWAPTPAVYDVEIGWYDPETGDRLPAHRADGSSIELVTLGKIEIVPEEQPAVEAPNRVHADLRCDAHNAAVTLLGYEIDGGDPKVTAGQTIDVTLYWQARSSLTENYTVFVHLADPSFSPYAQDDGQPRDGTYPTSYWDAGEAVTDTHTLLVPSDLPQGRYPLVAGMYLLETGERLPAFNMEGERLAMDAVPLTEVEVLP